MIFIMTLLVISKNGLTYRIMMKEEKKYDHYLKEETKHFNWFDER